MLQSFDLSYCTPLIVVITGVRWYHLVCVSVCACVHDGEVIDNLICRACSFSYTCSSCFVMITYHLGSGVLISSTLSWWFITPYIVTLHP